MSYLCAECDEPIVDVDPHSDGAGEDVHPGCCAWCQSDEGAAEAQAASQRSSRVDLGIVGHGGGLTVEQMARGEASHREGAA